MPLIGQTAKASTNSTSVTTTAIDTTGANFLVVAVSFYNGTASVSDNKGNTWVPLTLVAKDSFYDSAIQFFIVQNPTVGSGHTITATATFPSAAFAAFSGVNPLITVLEEGGASTEFAAAASITTPTLSPPYENVLIISASGASAAATQLEVHTSTPNYSEWASHTSSINGVGSTNEELGFTWREVTDLTGQYVIWKHGAVVEPTRTTTIAMFALGDAIPTPVTYENPCSITFPRVHIKIQTETETHRFAVLPLRESADLGGFKEPRILSLGKISRQASDPVTGSWVANSGTCVLADTDYRLRETSRARGNLRNSDIEVYLTSKAHSLIDGAPRILFSGKIYSDSADENLVTSISFNDIIGISYSLFADEKKLPQRTVSRVDCPNAADEVIGKGIPIVGGTIQSKSAGSGGAYAGVYVGSVHLGGTATTPGAGNLAAVVAALTSSAAGGNLYTEYGGRIGYGDATALQSYYDSYSSIPSGYDDLASIIGYGDLDALIAGDAVTGGGDYETVLVACHALKEILQYGGNPSIWVGDTQVTTADLGVSVWAPKITGDTTWASNFGSNQFTDLVGSDGVTRRYTLIAFQPGSTLGDAVKNGAQVSLEAKGMETVGDGSGTLISNFYELYLHVLVNFGIQSYVTGAWLTIPQFLFSDGVTLIDRIDADTFANAKTITDLDLVGGYIGAFVIGSGGDLESIRDVISKLNVSGRCFLRQDDFGRLGIRVIDYRRSEFLKNEFTGEPNPVLRDKIHFLPGFKVTPKPDWHANHIQYNYSKNYRSNSFERISGSGGIGTTSDSASIAKFGLLKKTFDFQMIADDWTAYYVAQYYLALLKNQLKVVEYTRRGLCGLEDDVLTAHEVTHFNGPEDGGWVEHCIFILKKEFDPKFNNCAFMAIDIEDLISDEVPEEIEYLYLDPVGGSSLVRDDTGDPLTKDT